MNIHVEIENPTDLMRHYTVREGFVFTSISQPIKVFDAIVIRHPMDCDCLTPKVGFSTRTFEDHLNFIRENRIEKALIISNEISFLPECPSLRCLQIVPADSSENHFDYSPLYKMPEIIDLCCRTQYGRFEQFTTTVDYSKIKGLRKLAICGAGHLHYMDVSTLEELRITENKNIKDMKEISRLSNLKLLDIVMSRLRSLDGIEQLRSLKQLSIAYCRCLQDVSSFGFVGQTLETIEIENCPQIKDFSFLRQMTAIRKLRLEGKNNIADLLFLNLMPNLEFFSLGMNVENGDITPCIGIPYVNIENHKHYNMKNSELSKDLNRTRNIE